MCVFQQSQKTFIAKEYFKNIKEQILNQIYETVIIKNYDRHRMK